MKIKHMKLYATISVITFLFISTFTLTAQDTGRGGTDRLEKINLDDVVRDYIRAARTTTRTGIKGKRIRESENLPFKKIGIAFSIGTTDIGFKLSTPINDQFKIRIGGGVIPPFLSMKKSYKIEDRILQGQITDEVLGHYTDRNVYPDYKVTFKPNFWNVHALVSYYPLQHIPFHITAGVYIGENEVRARGHLVDPESGNRPVLRQDSEGYWPYLRVMDYAVDVEKGVLDTDLKMGNLIKPYLGVGYGYVVPDTHWSINVDLGVLYQGKFKVYQFGKEAPKFEPRPGEIHESPSQSIKDVSKWENRVRFWPVLSFQVAYRIY